MAAAALVLILMAPSGERIDFRGDAAVRLKLLRHKRAPVRLRAAQLLGTAQPDEVLAGLLIALRDVDPGVRRAVANSLRRLEDERAVPFLVARLHEEKNPPTIAYLLLAAGTCGQEYVGRHLLPFLEHPARGVRLAAAAALGHVGDAQQRDALWAALRFAPDDPGFTVRSAILSSFVRLGWKDDVRGAIDALIEAGARRHWASRAAVVAAIGGAGLRERLPYVRAEIEADLDERVVSAAAGALAALGQHDEVYALLQHESTLVRRSALVSLHDAGDPRGVKAAATLVKSDPDTRVRFEAALVLDRANHADADLYLLDALRSKNAIFWITALQALERRHRQTFGRDPEAWSRYLRRAR